MTQGRSITYTVLSGAFIHVLQYVETLSEQLEGLRQSPTDRCECLLVACTRPEQTCRILTQLCLNFTEFNLQGRRRCVAAVPGACAAAVAAAPGAQHSSGGSAFKGCGTAPGSASRVVLVSLLHTTLLVVAIVPCMAAWRDTSNKWHSMAHHVTCRRLQPDGSAAPPAAATSAADASQLTGAARRTLDTQEQLQVCRDVCRAVGHSTYEAGRNSTLSTSAGHDHRRTGGHGCGHEEQHAGHGKPAAASVRHCARCQVVAEALRLCCRQQRHVACAENTCWTTRMLLWSTACSRHARASSGPRRSIAGVRLHCLGAKNSPAMHLTAVTQAPARHSH